MPAEVFHLCEYIAEECAARGWSLDRLAVEMGSTSDSELLIDRLSLDFLFTRDEHVRIGDDGAAKLGRAFGVSPQLFLNLEKAWLDGRAEAR